MKAIILILLTAMVLKSATSSSKWVAPSFCGGLECPKFNVVQKINDAIEIREYENSNWVSVGMKGDKDKSRKTCFWSLFNYISGKNSESKKIDMSAPVLMKYDAKIPFTAEENHGTMSFFLGYKFQEGEVAPKPTEDAVYLNKLESKKYGVISYSGYSNEKDQLENLVKLGTYLNSQNIRYVNDYFFYAGYDAPYKFWNRHNEIWVELI
jgi:hypothetical protein